VAQSADLSNSEGVVIQTLPPLPEQPGVLPQVRGQARPGSARQPQVRRPQAPPTRR
jgi:hypothetical protein